MKDDSFIKIISGILLIIITFSLSALTTTKKETVQYTEKSRFFVLHLPNDQEVSDFEILVDKETRVQYLFFREDYQCGLTPLLDEDGNITFYEGEIK